MAKIKIISTPNSFKEGGGIHIDPKNKGKFNEIKKRTGKTTEELTHSDNPLTRKRAIFALNAKKWKHDDGGNLFLEGGPEYPEDTDDDVTVVRGLDGGIYFIPKKKSSNKNTSVTEQKVTEPELPVDFTESTGHLLPLFNIVESNAPDITSSNYPIIGISDHISDWGKINSENLYKQYGTHYDDYTGEKHDYDYYLLLEKDINEMSKQRDEITLKYLSDLYDRSMESLGLNPNKKYDRKFDDEHMFPIVEHYNPAYGYMLGAPFSKLEYINQANYYRYINEDAGGSRLKAVHNWYRKFDNGLTDEIIRKLNELNFFNRNMWDSMYDIFDEDSDRETKNAFFDDVVLNNKYWLLDWLRDRKNILRLNVEDYYNYFDTPSDAHNRFNKELGISPEMDRGIHEENNKKFEDEYKWYDRLFATDKYIDLLTDYLFDSLQDNIKNTPVYIHGFGATPEQEEAYSKSTNAEDEIGLNNSKKGYYDPRTKNVVIPLSVFEGGAKFSNELNTTIAHELSHALNAEPQEYMIHKYKEDGDYLENGIEYDSYKDGDSEIYSRRNQLFRKLNINPKHKWTEEEIDLFKKDNPGFDIFNRYTKEFLLHLFNDVAQREDSTNNILLENGANYASFGGNLFADAGLMDIEKDDNSIGIKPGPNDSYIVPNSWLSFDPETGYHDVYNNGEYLGYAPLLFDEATATGHQLTPEEKLDILNFRILHGGLYPSLWLQLFWQEQQNKSYLNEAGAKPVLGPTEALVTAPILAATGALGETTSLLGNALDSATMPVYNWTVANPIATQSALAGLESYFMADVADRRLLKGEHPVYGEGNTVWDSYIAPGLLDAMDATIGFGALTKVPKVAEGVGTVLREGVGLAEDAVKYANNTYYRPWKLSRAIDESQLIPRSNRMITYSKYGQYGNVQLYNDSGTLIGTATTYDAPLKTVFTSKNAPVAAGDRGTYIAMIENKSPRVILDTENPFAANSYRHLENGITRDIYGSLASPEKPVVSGLHLLSPDKTRASTSKLEYFPLGEMAMDGTDVRAITGSKYPLPVEIPESNALHNIYMEDDIRFAWKWPFGRKTNTTTIANDMPTTSTLLNEEQLMQRVKEQLEMARLYKTSPEYLALLDRTTQEAVDLGYLKDGESLSLEEPNLEYPNIVLEERPTGNLGGYKKSTNTMSLDPQQLTEEYPFVPFHEGLHYYRIGEPGISNEENKLLDNWLDWAKMEEEYTNNGAASDVINQIHYARMRAFDKVAPLLDRRDATMEYYKYKVQLALQDNLSNSASKYIGKASELVENCHEAGKAVGLKTAQEYPGDELASKILDKAVEKNDWIKYLKAFKDRTPENLKIAWELLTGNYLASLFPAAVTTTAVGLETISSEDLEQ